MNEQPTGTDPLAGVNEDRRRFLRTVLAGSTLAVPVVVSMTLTGAAAAPQNPGVSGATTRGTGPTTTPTPGTSGTSTPTPTPTVTPTVTPTPTAPTTPPATTTATPRPTRPPLPTLPIED